ncbi:MAG: EamA family transporter [Muribaculaceae bacterium]|nr:EamA family transporter [Muribaculaceae bacterium]
MNPKVKGYILGAIAAATYGTNPLFALPLYAEGMDADSVLFFRYVLALPVIALMLKVRGHSFGTRSREVPRLALSGILVALSSLTLFESYNYMDAGIASTLLFVYPLMVAGIMTIFFGERLTLSTVLCNILALGGIGLLFKASDGATLSLTGTALVMASSLVYALYIVIVNRPGLREIPTLKIIFYVLCTGTLLFGAKILAGGGSFSTPSHWYMWGCVLALAVLPTVVSFLCTTAAIQYIGPTPTAILGALEPLTAVVIGISIFGETMTGRDWLGLVLIVTAVTLVVAGGKISQALVRFRKLFPRLTRKNSK